jgi:leucyl aminopeptidase
MQLQLQDVTEHATPLLAVFVVDTATGKDTPASLTALTSSAPILSAAADVLHSGEFKASLGEMLVLHKPDGCAAERLLLIGAGKAKDLSKTQMRKAAGTAVRAAKARALRELAIALPEFGSLGDSAAQSLPPAMLVQAAAEGAALAEPDWDTYRTERRDDDLTQCTLLGAASLSGERESMDAALREAIILTGAQNAVRALVNEPGNILTPTELGKRTAALCKEVGLPCEVYSTDTLREHKMGAFLAVAQGSAEPPALIVMTYEPEQAPAADAPVFGLVGKGITFDTGGISIKPADGMEKMKYDMAGAAAMIGAMQAIAQLKPPFKVIGVVCSAENMPDGKAYRPGDVVTAMSGKTIEILNTDAEGRLVLADGLHYAQTLGCTHLINAATLTGACVVALGKLNAGLFSNNDASAAMFLQAATTTGEAYWRLPCTDDYRDQIQSAIADIQNTGNSRYGGATTAAMFLKEFVGETAWVHLDIAGCAWNEEAKPWMPKGPSGIAVRSIVEWVRRYEQ